MRRKGSVCVHISWQTRLSLIKILVNKNKVL